MDLMKVLLLASVFIITATIIHFVLEKILVKIGLSKGRAKIISSETLYLWIILLILAGVIYYSIIKKIEVEDVIFLNVICMIIAVFFAYILSLR